jgi:hypothetical protein
MKNLLRACINQLKQYNFTLTFCTARTSVSRIAETGTSIICWLAENATYTAGYKFVKWGTITAQ